MNRCSCSSGVSFSAPSFPAGRYVLAVSVGMGSTTDNVELASRGRDLRGMIVSLSINAIVEAECRGSGRLPWAWVFLCGETAVVLAQSEPMFRTRSAALRVGEHVMRHRRFRQRRDRSHEESRLEHGDCRASVC